MQSMWTRAHRVLMLAGWLAAIGAAGCTPKQPGPSQGVEGSTMGTGAGQHSVAVLTVTSTFAEGQPIPPANACKIPHKGDCEYGVSPRLAWSPGPPQTASYAVLVCDPDGRDWLHWVIGDIPATATAIEEAASGACKAQVPAGAKDGKNEFGTMGYGGPCPPAGSGVHHYIFTVYALPTAKTSLPDSTKCADARNVLDPQAIGKGTLTGTYRIDR